MNSHRCIESFFSFTHLNNSYSITVAKFHFNLYLVNLNDL